MSDKITDTLIIIQLIFAVIYIVKLNHDRQKEKEELDVAIRELEKLYSEASVIENSEINNRYKGHTK